MTRLFLGIITILFLVGIAFAGSFVWNSYLLTPQKDAQDVTLEIPEGSSVSFIARALKDKHIITSPFFFKAYTYFSDTQSSLQAGFFVLKPQMSFRSIVAVLSNAKSQEVQVTIPEGYTKDQIGTVIMAVLPKITAAEWKEASKDQEGFLFPDTYRFRADADAKTIVQTMNLTLTRRLAENKIVVPQTRVMPNGMSFDDVVILASIVEREVRSSQEMATVAGIFLKRLKIGMALQADSTVNYVTGKQTPGISLDDTKLDSPYNTYQNLGLPPGPISNPGMNAIRAVLNPVMTDNLYFLTTPEGKVIYSKTFEEHVANKFRYLK